MKNVKGEEKKYGVTIGCLSKHWTNSEFRAKINDKFILSTSFKFKVNNNIQFVIATQVT